MHVCYLSVYSSLGGYLRVEFAKYSMYECTSALFVTVNSYCVKRFLYIQFSKLSTIDVKHNRLKKRKRSCLTPLRRLTELL